MGGVKNYLILVDEPKLTWFLCRGIEIDLNLVWGSKLTWSQWWVEINFIFVWGSNCTSCFVLVVEDELISVSGSELNGFFFKGSKSTWL